MPESENTETPPVEIPEIAKTPDKAPEISALLLLLVLLLF